MRKSKRPEDKGVIPLEDLIPRKDPKGGRGGSGKTVFGEGPVIPGSGESGIGREDRASKKNWSWPMSRRRQTAAAPGSHCPCMTDGCAIDGTPPYADDFVLPK
jgi:hypothetical protein